MEHDLNAGSIRFDTAIHSVEGLDQPFALDVILKGDIIDVAINGERTLIASYPNWQDKEIFLFCVNGDVTFRDVRLMPIQDDAQST